MVNSEAFCQVAFTQMHVGTKIAGQREDVVYAAYLRCVAQWEVTQTFPCPRRYSPDSDDFVVWLPLLKGCIRNVNIICSIPKSSMALSKLIIHTAFSVLLRALPSLLVQVLSVAPQKSTPTVHSRKGEEERMHKKIHCFLSWRLTGKAWLWKHGFSGPNAFTTLMVVCSMRLKCKHKVHFYLKIFSQQRKKIEIKIQTELKGTQWKVINLATSNTLHLPRWLSPLMSA